MILSAYHEEAQRRSRRLGMSSFGTVAATEVARSRFSAASEFLHCTIFLNSRRLCQILPRRDGRAARLAMGVVPATTC